MSLPTPSYRAFISYRHVMPDRRWAKWLHRSLETYRIPRALAAGGSRRLGRCFRDEEELAASPDLGERIGAALQASDCLILVCSPRTPQSRWVDEEVRRFRDLGRGDRILVLLIEGEPADSFPPALQTGEPLAADVRPSPEGGAASRRRTALLKLVAAILRVDYDTLRRRDEERARRRLAGVAASAAGAAVVFLGLGLFATQQWRRAEDQLTTSRALQLAATAQASAQASAYARLIGTFDPSRSALLALESLSTDATPEGDAALRAAWGGLNPASDFTAPTDCLLSGISADGETVGFVSDPWNVPLPDAGEAPPSEDAASSEAGCEWSVAQMRLAQLAEIGAASWRSADADGFDSERPDAFARLPVLAVSAVGGVRLEADSADPDQMIPGADLWLVDPAGARRFRLPHEWLVRRAGFTADGAWLVTVTGQVSMDASSPSATRLPGSAIRVWRVADGRLVSDLSLAADGGVTQVVLGAGNRWIAAATPSADGSRIRVWPTAPDLLRQETCARLERNLSPSEWTAFIPWRTPRETCPGLPVESE